MTTMATAVMDTDHTDHMRRRHLDLDLERRIGHLRVPGVPGGGDVIIRTAASAHDSSMIPKSGHRFSEKIMLKQKGGL
jgi:hypothetical protein